VRSEGTFVWDQTQKPMSPGYTNWAPGEPSNSNDEDCVQMYDFQHSWNDRSCAEAHPAICEASPGVVNFFFFF